MEKKLLNSELNRLGHTIIQNSHTKKPYIVGISGIDGSGKGYVSKKLFNLISDQNLKCSLIGIDGWLQPPGKRFSNSYPAQHFYESGLRFDEMQMKLFEPLQQFGSVDCIVKHADPTNNEAMVDYHYQIQEPDIIIFEGIFLFQSRFTFDYSIWIECSYETALKRALQRNQEKLGKKQILKDYQNIYFAAQKIHLKTDTPKDRCDYILHNDFQNSKKNIN